MQVGRFAAPEPQGAWLCFAPTAPGAVPITRRGRWDTPAFAVGELSMHRACTPVARGGWAPGQSALNLGTGAHFLAHHSGDRSVGPVPGQPGPPAPTESSPGTRCPQGVQMGLGTRGYRATPRGGLQGTWRAPWGSPDAAPTPSGGGSGRPLPPCAPEDLQLHPAGAAQSADARARVRAGELPRHGRAPCHPARRRARRPRPPGQVGPRLPPDTPDPPPGRSCPLDRPAALPLPKPWPPPQLQAPGPPGD